MSEDKIPNDSQEETEISGNESKITIKKSTYNKMLVAIVGIVAIATFFGGYSIGSFDDSSLSDEQLKEILSEIKTAPTPQPTQSPQPSAPQLFAVSFDGEPVKGNPNAPITIVEFSDFQCPFCSRFFEQTLPLIEKNYIDTGKIKFVYKDLPLDRLHPNARSAHIAAECADEEGKFWEYHDVLFQKQAAWQRLASSDLDIILSQFAVDLGMQAASFESCMESQDIADEINQDTLEAAKYGTTGTPTFFIGTEKDGFIKMVGAQPFASFQRVIDEQLG